LASYGEVHFVLLGVLIQLLSQVFEVTKITLMNVLMQRGGTRLDPLTTVFFMAPVCFVFCFFLFLVTSVGDMQVMFGHATEILPFLLVNSLLAFLLNLLVAMQIWMFNGVGFLLVGIIKDIVIVVSSSIAFHEVISHKQTCGFVLALVGVIAYSVYQMHLDLFKEDSITVGFSRVVHSVSVSLCPKRKFAPSAFAEKKPLLSKESETASSEGEASTP